MACKLSDNKKAEGKAAALLVLVTPAWLLCLLLPWMEEEKVLKDYKCVHSKGSQSWQCNNDVLATSATWTENCYPRHREQGAAQELLRSFPPPSFTHEVLYHELTPNEKLGDTTVYTVLRSPWCLLQFRQLRVVTICTAELFHSKNPCLTTTRQVFSPPPSTLIITALFHQLQEGTL